MTIFDRMRTVIENRFLTDTLRVYPLTRATNGKGMFTEVLGTPFEYEGSIEIPCFVKRSRQFFRGAEVFDAEAIENEYEIHIPYDAPLSPDHSIYYKGVFLEILKMGDLITNNPTKWFLAGNASAGAGLTNFSITNIAEVINELEVTFTPTVIGGLPPYTYSWDFGDGGGTSTLEIPTHVYTVPGDYTVTLTVTDNDGLETSAISPITVDVSLNILLENNFALLTEDSNNIIQE